MELTETKRKLFIFTLLAGTFTMSISQSALSTAYPALMHCRNDPMVDDRFYVNDVCDDASQPVASQ